MRGHTTNTVNPIRLHWFLHARRFVNERFWTLKSDIYNSWNRFLHASDRRSILCKYFNSLRGEPSAKKSRAPWLVGDKEVWKRHYRQQREDRTTVRRKRFTSGVGTVQQIAAIGMNFKQAGHLKGLPPAPTTSTVRAASGVFAVVIVDEYLTSQKCYLCTSQLKCITNDDTGKLMWHLKWCPKCQLIHDRDDVGSANIRSIAVSNERPSQLCRGQRKIEQEYIKHSEALQLLRTPLN